MKNKEKWKPSKFIRARGRLRASHLAGPVAGGTEHSRGYSLYLAYFSNQPWYGGGRPAKDEELVRSSARTVVVARDEPLARQLASNRRFRDLDRELLGDLTAAARSPLKAFESLH